MKKAITIIFIVLLSHSFASNLPDSTVNILYTIDVTDYSDDLFHVSVSVDGLTPENNIYNFAATAPGVYDVLDFGRFVKLFKAYDDQGEELGTNKISTNRWQISSPEKLAKVIYQIEDTFDSESGGEDVAPPGGTGIQDDYIVINTFGVLGFFEGLQSNPCRLKVKCDEDWTLGTAMDIDSNGYFYTNTFDRLADSPILIGELTEATIKVNDIDVSVYLYISDIDIEAQDLLSYTEEVLLAAGEFIGYSPVPYYKFLCVLLDYDSYKENIKSVIAGALEHSYSSLYVLAGKEEDLPELKNTMAHEFMHILTPLNLHSEIIQSFNFEVPTASEHLWLYEGVTEWVSDIMQLRSGIIDLEEYLKRLRMHLLINDVYDSNVSLSEMSLEVYGKLNNQFSNFYHRGAATACLLDIKLLELSDGALGFRELYLELLKKYGKNKPFSEENFFNTIVDMTYPEIGGFIHDYIKNANPLPIKEYMNKMGIEYIEEMPSEDKRPSLGFAIAHTGEDEFLCINVTGGAYELGLRNEDRVLKLLGEDFNDDTKEDIIEKRNNMKPGDAFDLVVERDGEELSFTLMLVERRERHIFNVHDNITEEQNKLLKSWISYK